MTDEQSQQHVDERLFFKFAQAVLSLVESRAKTEGIQRLTTSRSQFTEEGLATVVEERPAYWLLFRDLIENIASLPEAEEFARFALAKGVIRTPKLSDASGQPILAPTFEQVRPFIVHQLTTPVQDTLERTGSFQISDDRLLATYRTCRAAWMASTLTWLVVIPLINFDSDVSEINFGDLLLQPLAPEEKTAFGDIYFLDRMISLLELSQTQFKLAGSYKTEIDEPRSSAELIASATEIVTAMRLLKAGDAGASAAFERGTSTLSSGIGAQQMRETQTRGWFMGAAYHLEEADVPALLTIKSTLARGRNSFVRPLAVALRRFNQAYARETAEDRLIDLTVCLESCLLSGVEDELKYRLSLRAAALLADRNDPERTQVMLNAVYQARSSIVHSGKQLSDVAAMMKSLGGLTPAVQPHELPQHCEDLVRKELMAYLTHLSAGRSVADIKFSWRQRHHQAHETSSLACQSPPRRQFHSNKDLDRKIVRSLRAEFPSERQ